jgi:hypothetical protein
MFVEGKIAKKRAFDKKSKKKLKKCLQTLDLSLANLILCIGCVNMCVWVETGSYCKSAGKSRLRQIISVDKSGNSIPATNRGLRKNARWKDECFLFCAFLDTHGAVDTAK